jgi:3-hydroxybutyryl-CoA dehydrogenase
MSIQRAGVIGAGLMGSGIAQACATSGIAVTMVDINDAAVQRGRDTISGSLDRLVKREKLKPDEKDAALARIKGTTSYDDLKGLPLVVEAATENPEIKLRILRQVDGLVDASAFIGIHFFNPVPVMALVELIRGLQTADEAHAIAEAFVKALGKTPITVKNSPGFVVNRILCPMINEAILVLQEGLASAEEIDAGMRLGCNHPIGPLALADLVGLDTLLAVMNVFYEGFNDPKYRPALLLKEMVNAGYLGRKSGRGFYRYG